MELNSNERDPPTHRIIGAAMEVRRQMGPGFVESVYQRCFEHELSIQGVDCQPQARLIHEAQLLTYLCLSKTHVGLLINFNLPVLKDGIKRMVL